VPANTEPGFLSFALDVASTPGPVTRQYGGAEVTLAAVGGINVQSRKRPAPTNTLAFTQEKLLQDFFFAADTTMGQGMDITLDFLDPNTTYEVTVWSYDNVSGGNRISDWYANGVFVRDSYTFNGTTLPTDDSTYQFTFTSTSDAHGRILIQARRNSTASVANNVFINALRAVRKQIAVRTIEQLGPGSLRMTIDGIDPSKSHSLEQTTTVENPSWSTVLDAVFDPPAGNTVQVTLGTPAATRFYRVVETP
jgi:hypothetical protein